MILNDVLDMDLIDNKTYITIENRHGFPIVGGNRNQDKIRKYSDYEVLELDLFSLTNKVIIRVWTTDIL